MLTYHTFCTLQTAIISVLNATLRTNERQQYCSHHSIIIYAMRYIHGYPFYLRAQYTNIQCSKEFSMSAHNIWESHESTTWYPRTTQLLFTLRSLYIRDFQSKSWIFNATNVYIYRALSSVYWAPFTEHRMKYRNAETKEKSFTVSWAAVAWRIQKEIVSLGHVLDENRWKVSLSHSRNWVHNNHFWYFS